MAKYRTLNLDLKNGLITSELTKDNKNVLEVKPVTYIYYNLKKKKVYIGETNNFMSRHAQHLGEKEPKLDYREYSNCLVVYSVLFNKSVILDLESLLINYMMAESKTTKFIFLNGNTGQSELQYANKEEILTEVFYPLWTNELFELKLIKNKDLNALRESLLFKYSPFKNLSAKQREIKEIVEQNYHENYIVDAPAGSGKSVLFTNLAFSLSEKNPNLKIGVVTTGNLIAQFNLIFKSVGLSDRLKVLTGSQLITHAQKNDVTYDLIIVDEAHKLKKYYTKGHANARRHLKEGEEEIMHLKAISKGMVLLYDPFQGIKPQNISPSEMTKLTDGCVKLKMTQQFRIGANSDFSGEDFLNGILYGLQLSDEENFNRDVFKSDYFSISNSFEELVEYVENKTHSYDNTTNRVIAGYCREWKSNPGKKCNKGKNYDELEYDWDIDGVQKRWNSTYEDWVKRENSEVEIGSIHAIQGYDLNYAGVVIGNDISVRDGRLVAVPENYKDVGGTPLKEEFDINELTNYILNIYYVLLSRGMDVRFGLKIKK